MKLYGIYVYNALERMEKQYFNKNGRSALLHNLFQPDFLPFSFLIRNHDSFVDRNTYNILFLWNGSCGLNFKAYLFWSLRDVQGRAFVFLLSMGG